MTLSMGGPQTVSVHMVPLPVTVPLVILLHISAYSYCWVHCWGLWSSGIWHCHWASSTQHCEGSWCLHLQRLNNPRRNAWDWIKAQWGFRRLFTQWHSITFCDSWLLGNTVLRTSHLASFVFPTHRVVYLTTKSLWACLWSVLVLDPFSEELLSRCQMPCGAMLSCDHRCRGTCRECMQGRIHMACKEKCGKTLICGHRYWLLVNILDK